MKFYEERYYRVNRIFLSSIGLWPYDNSGTRQIKIVILLLMYLSFLFVQLMRLVFSEYNLDILLKIMSFMFFAIQWGFKYITFYGVLENVKQIHQCVRNNWSILKNDQEIEIMHKHSNTGKMLTLIVAMGVYSVLFICLMLQYAPDLLDFAIPLNESRPRKLLIVADYLIDQQKYFHILTVHVAVSLFVIATVGIATETFALTNALHAFGMFKIASYRMKRILRENDLQKCIIEKYMMSHGRIVAAVDIHKRAIEFSELLKASFGIPYLCLFVISELSASISLFYLFRSITLEKELLDILSSCLCIMTVFLFLIVGNFVGQEFRNCDGHVHQMICNTRWYDAPLKTQKLILFLLQKTTKGYQVDAGGMFSPCLEGLAMGMSMLFSFFMVLYSVQS